MTLRQLLEDQKVELDALLEVELGTEPMTTAELGVTAEIAERETRINIKIPAGYRRQGV